MLGSTSARPNLTGTSSDLVEQGPRRKGLDFRDPLRGVGRGFAKGRVVVDGRKKN